MLAKGKLIVFVLFLCLSKSVMGQAIGAPELNVPSYACATPGFNTYYAEFAYSSPGFPSSNVFYLELSDANGNFSNPTLLTTITGESYQSAWIVQDIEFSFPEDIGGDNFRLRVRASDPAITGAVSQPYGYYWYGGEFAEIGDYNGPGGAFQLLGAVNLCGGGSKTIFIEPAGYDEYRWYRNSTEIPGETGPSLEVSQAGTYFAEVYLGPCNVSIPESVSNALTVSVSGDDSFTLLGATDVLLCEGDAYTLEVSEDNSSYTYTWFKDNIAVAGPGYIPTLDVSGATAAGTYYARIDASGCESSTNEVVITTDDGFEVTAVTALSQMFLGNPIPLRISTDATNPTITWFRDGLALPASDNEEYIATLPGAYIAQVVDGGACMTSIDSDEFTVFTPTGYDVSIIPQGGYSPCTNPTATLLIDTLTAFDLNGNPNVIDPSQYGLFSFQWLKDGSVLTGATSETLTLTNPVDNGSQYQLEVATNATSFLSNSLEIDLQPDPIEIVGPTDIALCPGDNHTLVADQDDANYLYSWYRNGTLIAGPGYLPTLDLVASDNSGVYYAAIELGAGGCVIATNEVNITYQDDFEVTEVSPLSSMFLGAPVLLEISTTAPSPTITWFKDGVAISGSDNLVYTATETGTYHAVVVGGGSCSGTETSEDFTVFEPTGYEIVIAISAGYIPCESETVTLEIDTLIAYDLSGNPVTIATAQYPLFSFQWLMENNSIAGATGETLVITDPANNGNTYQLQASINTTTAASNTFDIALRPNPINLLGAADVALCPGDNYTLEAEVDDANYSYTWYKNETVIAGPAYLPSIELDAADNSGVYYAAITLDAGGCSVTTNDVTVSYQNEFQVTAVSALEQLFLGATVLLEISTNAANPTITWYKDGAAIPDTDDLTYAATETGQYFAEVVGGGSCGGLVNSDVFTVFEPTGYAITIAAQGGYTDCADSTASIGIDSLIAFDLNGNGITINPAQYGLFDFQWLLEDEELVGETSTTLTVTDILQNGKIYLLEIRINSALELSNALQLFLQPADVSITASQAQVCEGVFTTLSAPEDVNYTYTWYRNESLLAEETEATLVTDTPGDYFVQVTAYECVVTSNLISITEFDLSGVTVSPDTTVTVGPNTTQTLTASGASTYIWYDANQNSVSNEAIFEATEPGTYYLVASVGDCQVQQEITVLYSETISVPNVITPNGDGINETWTLPAPFQSAEVEVTILSGNGQVLFQTTNYQGEWPSTGAQLPKGERVFYYVIRRNEEIIKKGTITTVL